jgi:uncharacterized protein YceK
MSVASIVFAIIVIILSGCVDSSLEKELQAQQKQYCEMVETHKNTGGQHGWPDYKNVYEEKC